MNMKTIPMRALSLLLCLVMVFSLLPISALAGGEGTGGGGAGTESGHFPGHSAGTPWGSTGPFAEKTTRFTRYTLIRMPVDGAENWRDNGYDVIGSVDLSYSGSLTRDKHCLDSGHGVLKMYNGGAATVSGDFSESAPPTVLKDVAWYDTNAMLYAAEGLEGVAELPVEKGKKVSDSLLWASPDISEDYIKNNYLSIFSGADDTLWANNHFITSDELTMYSEWLAEKYANNAYRINRVTDDAKLADFSFWAGVGKSAEVYTHANAFQGSFLSEEEQTSQDGSKFVDDRYDDGVGHGPTPLFNTLLMYLFNERVAAVKHGRATMPADLAGAILPNNDVDLTVILDSFFELPSDLGSYDETNGDNGDGAVYRLLIEPGMLFAANGYFYAFTMRDAAMAYMLGQSWLRGQCGATLVEHAKSMYPLLDEFKTYVPVKNGNEVSTKIITPGQPGSMFGSEPFAVTINGYSNADFKGVAEQIFNDKVGWALGVLSGYEFAFERTQSEGLSVKKTVTGNEADTSATWGFAIKMSTTASGATFTLHRNGTETDITSALSGGKTFLLENSEDADGAPVKANESFRISVEGVEEDDTITYEVTEQQVVDGKTKYPGDDAHDGYDVTIAAPTGATVDGSKGTVSGSFAGNGHASVTFTNQKGELEGKGNAHLLIDYNMPTGVTATNGTTDDTITAEVPVDCGQYESGAKLTVKPYINGTPLVGGHEEVLATGVTDSGEAVSAVATYNGIYTAADGGTLLSDQASFEYTLPHDDLTVLYAQWDMEMRVGGDPLPSGGGDFQTVFWNLNYDGGGVTSSLYGSANIKVNVTVSCLDAEGNVQTNNGNGSTTLKFKWTVPDLKPYTEPGGDTSGAYRNGYWFMGWVSGDNWFNFKDSHNESLIVTKPTADDLGNSSTFYAVWKAKAYTFNANGGTMPADKAQALKTHMAGFGVNCNVTGTTFQFGEMYPYGSNTGVLPMLDFEPTRTGYTFNGWYWDPECTIPVQRSPEDGMQPGRGYYAGWTAEKVYVTYHDTRDGNGTIATQTYNYGDVLTLLPDMNSTDGWDWSGWSRDNGLVLDESVLTYHEGTHGASDMSDAGYWTLDVATTWNLKEAVYNAMLVWNDYQNNDGCRPRTVTLGLISSEQNREVAEKTVTVDRKLSNQPVTFTTDNDGNPLPITKADSSVEHITYSVYLKSYTDVDGDTYTIQNTSAKEGEIEVATISNADTAVKASYKYALNSINYGGVNAYSGTLYFDHNLITTGEDVKFAVIWSDKSDNDGKRPDHVMLTLYANGVPVQDVVDHHGTSNGEVYVSPSKDLCAVSEDGNTWTYTFKDYQKYSDGKEIKYTVGISDYNDAEYTLLTPNPTTGGCILKHDIEMTEKLATVVWDDNQNRDGLRPEKVTVELVAMEWNRARNRWDEVSKGIAELTGGSRVNTWSHLFTDIPRYHGGQEIDYVVRMVTDLNAHIGPGENGYTTVAEKMQITASHKRNLKSLPVMVEWDDDNNNDTIRPKAVIVQLYADGVRMPSDAHAVVLSGDVTANTWEYTFENLPVNRDGKEGEPILYTIGVDELVKDSVYGTFITMANGEEEEVVRYTASYRDADGNTVDTRYLSAYPYVNLSHDTQQGTITLYAAWHDGSNRDGKRPTSVQAELYKQVDGKQEWMKSVTMVAGKDLSWTYQLTGLPLYENGKAVTYFAEVSKDTRDMLLNSNGYTVSPEGNIINLYYTPETGSITGQVVWNDNEDNDALRPDTVNATLYANGKATGQTLELNRENDWTATWTDLAVYYNNNGKLGTPVQYSIVVDAPDGYAVSYTPETVTVKDNQVIYIDLAHTEDIMDVPVSVYWSDNSNKDAKRPASVEVQLYANGEKVVGKTLTLSGDGDTWTGVFENMPIYAGGEPIDYSAKPNDDVSSSYAVLTAGTSIYLSRDTATANMTVSFDFRDDNNADGVRPKGLYLTLTANGEEVNEADYVRTVYFDADDHYNLEFNDLPVYSRTGSHILYNVVVELDPVAGSTDYTVTTSKDITLSEKNSNVNKVVVILSRASDLGTETGHIYWFDANNQRGNRPTTLEVNVWRDNSVARVGRYTINSVNGKVTDATGKEVGVVTVTEWGVNNDASCWTYTIDGLQQNAVYDGVSNEIYYYSTAVDTGLSNWYKVIDGKDNGLDVNLTHNRYTDDVVSSKQDFSIELDWLDNDDAWSYRPNTAGVDVTLYANGEAYKTVHLTRSNAVEGNSNAWAYTFTGLPTYLKGSAVVWTAGVEDVSKYTETVSNTGAYAVMKMTQSIGFDFTARWDDSKDDDAVRPQAIVLDIYADGTKVNSVTLTGEGETWTGSVSDLPVWREVGAATPVAYSFSWDTDTNATLIDNYYSASATNHGEAVEANAFYYLSASEWGDRDDAGLNDLSGQYRVETTLHRNKELIPNFWAEILFDDDADRDGIRPETLRVQLLKNGVAFGEPVVITVDSTDSSWTAGWENLDRYEGGKEIVYTAKLLDAPDNYDMVVDETGTKITLTHTPAVVDVTATVNWNDSSEIRYATNSRGEILYQYAQIDRTDVYVQLLKDGEPFGEPLFIGKDGYGTGKPLAGYASYTFKNLSKYEEQGKSVEYTIRVYSDDLDALLADGHSLTYDFATEYKPSATVAHDLYDVRGTVYYLYDTDDSFLMKNAPVTAYLYDAETDTYTAVGSTVTDENGKFELLNLPQGLLTIRSTRQNGDYAFAGSTGLRLDRHDGEVTVVVNRDAQADSDLYRYAASGNAYYQTDKTDDATITPVPAGSIVLLYKTVNGEDTIEYVGMTTADADGHYRFEGLASGSYFVNVVFNYNDATYTYDNGDAVNDGLTFIVSGINAEWPDIVKQVNAVVDPNPGPDEPITPPVDPIKPVPCVVSGDVFFSDNGKHTTDPVDGVDVYIYAAENNAELAKTVTDENGHWTVEGLAAADYIAVFSYQGNASRVLLFTVTDADYEAGEYTAATQYFDRSTKTPTSTITGVVLDENGKRVPALVKVLGEDGTLVAHAYTDKAGAYMFTVPAGFTYEVQILKVSADTTAVKVGDPDDAYTTLNYYTVSGNFSIDDEAQSGATVAVYRQNADLEFDLLTATLTDGNGDFNVKLTDSGNYQVMMYRDGAVYAKHNVSVGYQEYEPVVTEKDGQYVISGAEAFDSLVLYDTTTSVVRTVKELKSGTQYSITVPAGTYDLKLVQNGVEKHYYLDAPNTVLTVKHFITVSGSVLDASGNAELGAIVALYNADGEQVGSDVVITDGAYSFGVLPEGEYEVRVSKVTGADMMVSKTTKDRDSYGNAYPDGMTENALWSWNINAAAVSGKVTDREGNPIPGAEVVLRDKNDPNRAYATLTDDNGDWTLGVPAGSYTADAMFEASAGHVYHAEVPKDLNVTNSGMDDVTLTISRAKLTGVVVRGGDEKRLSGAKVEIVFEDNGEVVWSGKTDKNGEFTTPLYQDDYIIKIAYRSFFKTVEIAQHESMGKNDRTVKFVLESSMSLNGTVYDTDGVTPVTDGIVYYDGAVSGKVYTDENGHYEIPIAKSEIGYYTVYAEASGNTSSRLSAYVDTDTTLNLTLTKNNHDAQYTLSGLVTDNEGNRLSNAVVTLVYGDDKAQTMKTSTNARGEYRFDVADGTYYLTAAYESDNGYTYGTNAETAVHINGASVTDRNLVIVLSYELTVRVLDTNGASVAGATVNYGGADSGTVTTDENGEAVVMLPGGQYNLQAVMGNRTSPEKNINLAKNADVILTIGALGLADEPPVVEAHDMTIDGNVIAPDGTPVEGAKVTLSKWDAAAEEWVEVKVEFSDKDGYYQFTGLENGTYKVDVEYTLTDTVTTDANTFDITGVALDDGENPYVGATVNLYKDELLVSTVYTDERGYYEFLNLERGNYTVEIIPVGDEENKTVIDKTPEPGNAVIEGTVLDAAGRPVEGATVTVTSEGGDTWTTVTDATGEYHFELPADGEYQVAITYPSTTEIPTDSYKPDTEDPNAPQLTDDSFSISGVVKDTDGNVVEGAVVILKDADGNEIDRTTSDAEGKYVFDDLAPGNYSVEVIWNGNGRDYDVDTGDAKEPDDPTPVDPDLGKVLLAGIVTTDHKLPLAGAVVTVKNLDTGKTLTITVGEDARFGTLKLDKGRYEVSATYTHSYGSNASDTLTFTASDTDVVLVIVLSYQADVNGDGKPEQVFAGPDDTFDTTDDFYPAEVGGKPVDVVAGTDRVPGTTDDHYAYDVDGDGKPDKVYVGDDRIPGTEDDWYPYDVDGDGNNEKVYIGEDEVPGTDDDWYLADPDDDGADEKVFIGDDETPGTDDDWYLDDDGEKTFVGITVILNANGGTVNGKAKQKILLKDFRTLPNASRTDYRFDGWYTQVSGGVRMDDAAVKALTKTTTLFAHWTKNETGGNTGGGGGNFGGGGTTQPTGESFTVTFDTDGGSKVAPQTVNKGDYAKQPRTPVKAGFAFTGWYLNGIAFDFTATPIKSDITLTAKWTAAGVKGLLNTDDHIAYISGYPDGLVKPEANITRAEVAMIFYRLLNDDVRAEYESTAMSHFTDVSETAWYSKAISTLAELGILSGYEDGTFRPDNRITRAEFAAICAKVDELSDGTKTFVDVPATHWAMKYIASAAEKGWISGYPDGSFHPDANITRAEAMSLINRVLGRANLTLDSFAADMKTWPDNQDKNAWFYMAVQEATNAHDYRRADELEVWTKIIQPSAQGD